LNKNPFTKLSVRNVLCTEIVKEFLDEHFIVWLGDVSYEDGYQAAMKVQNSTPFTPIVYPYTAVVFYDYNTEVTKLQPIKSIFHTQMFLYRHQFVYR
jgi:hypothetical protein